MPLSSWGHWRRGGGASPVSLAGGAAHRGPCLRLRGWWCCLTQVWVGLGRFRFSSLGFHCICALLPPGGREGPQQPCALPGCPSLWHCHGWGRGKCILPLPQGQSGKLVLSYWALLAPPPPWTSLARLGQGKGPCWAHSGLVSMTTPGWPGAGGAADGAEGQLGWRSAPPGSVAPEARCPYVGNGPAGWRQAAHLLCRLGLGRGEGFTVYVLLL